MTEYEKLELLHSQLDELINGNKLPIDELKILQFFIEDIREKYLIKKWHIQVFLPGIVLKNKNNILTNAQANRRPGNHQLNTAL